MQNTGVPSVSVSGKQITDAIVSIYFMEKVQINETAIQKTLSLIQR